MTTPERSVEEIVEEFRKDFWKLSGTSAGELDRKQDEYIANIIQTERQRCEEMVEVERKRLSYWLKHDIQCAVEFEAGDCDCGLKEALTQPNNPK